jgi:subtilisin family serine protease
MPRHILHTYLYLTLFYVSLPDVLFVVAAGNTATDLDAEPSYPASYASEFSNIIVVASTDYKDRMSNFSSYGATTVHVAAPGEW